MEDFGIQDDKSCLAVLEIRNSFFELRECQPRVVRVASEPALSSFTSYFNEGSTTLSSTSTSPSSFVGTSADDGTDESKKSVQGGVTVIVRDLPCRVGHERMMLELKRLGFDGCYDSVNFPLKMKDGKESHKGYGFVSFFKEDDAHLFMRMFENHRFDDINSEKVARVELARLQGKTVRKQIARSCRKKKGFASDSHGLKAP
eukprot:TRINITY_DN25420_c0_g1_i1.p1 TRINITY_DN25420_c0_g1~~TRINITY_DN25420_c0_g1_i1.p1  ORF type:complete len:202 (-),score=30.70 TRINITY_DN25420_c0_g1_i1:452-1057(-)